MGDIQNIMMIVMPILVIGVSVGMSIHCYRDYRSVIKRAQKIDPTVRTRSEAEYVLKKDIAESMGKNNIDK